MSNQKNNIVVYTAITGKYDNLLTPKHIVPGWTYFCFSDTILPPTPPWKMHKLPEALVLNSIKQARYVKTHPHKLFPKHDIAIWCDANILIKGDLRELTEKFIKEKALFAAITHPYRRCTYKEGHTCKILKKDKDSVIDAQMKRYKDIGFPVDAGLFETGFFITRPHEPKMKQTFDIWWSEIEKGSHRDQLSVMYAFRKTGVGILPLLKPKVSVRNHHLFSHLLHKNQSYVSQKRRI